MAGSTLCAHHGGVQPQEGALVAVVSGEATAGNWRAAAWLLERRWPERWSRRGGGLFEPAVEDGPDALDELAARRDSRRGQ